MGDGAEQEGGKGGRGGGRVVGWGQVGCGSGGSPIEDQRMCSTDGHINGYLERVPNDRVSEDEGEGGKGE